jgi:hypothetical protein
MTVMSPPPQGLAANSLARAMALAGLALVACGNPPVAVHPAAADDSGRQEAADPPPPSSPPSPPTAEAGGDPDPGVDDSPRERIVRIRGVRVVEVNAAPVCGPKINEPVTNWWTASCRWLASESKYGTAHGANPPPRVPVPRPLPPVDDPPPPRRR